MKQTISYLQLALWQALRAWSGCCGRTARRSRASAEDGCRLKASLSRGHHNIASEGGGGRNNFRASFIEREREERERAGLASCSLQELDRQRAGRRRAPFGPETPTCPSVGACVPLETQFAVPVRVSNCLRESKQGGVSAGSTRTVSSIARCIALSLSIPSPLFSSPPSLFAHCLQLVVVVADVRWLFAAMGQGQRWWWLRRRRRQRCQAERAT